MANPNMNNSKTLAGIASQTREIRELPVWMKALVNIAFVIPTIFVVVYGYGWWDHLNMKDTTCKIITSGTDTSIATGVMVLGITGVACLNFVIKYLEDRR